MPTLTVYPNLHIESTSVDGDVWHEYDSGAGQLWTVIRSATGSAFDDDSDNAAVYIVADTVTDKWLILKRTILLFDTSALPDTATITSAKVRVRGCEKRDGLSIAPDIVVVSSAPASNTALAAGDYDSLGTTALSNVTTYAAFDAAGWNEFTLNASGLAAISLTGITKFGLRNKNYDIDNVAPAWSNANSGLWVCTAEDATGYKPELVITYDVATSQTFTAAIGLVPSFAQEVDSSAGAKSQSFATAIGLVPSITQAGTCV
jgi:hypothetical protein